ncbi:Glycosyltransferase, GT2 family [Butyrivibrio sp. INlla18]|uniref:DUF6492 family protein n=1 Tax=Butyrivibrio sp. INlla18 TaxID=1520806 RepID=UPI00088F25AA|nr:DUF6492 family protein [Butyrivibrio sp. INlla18]SDA41951.1 Glycosyltransferase, GT2 family [Butyrivibrio sp. INlla18]
MVNHEHFDTLIVITAVDCKRLLSLYPRLVDNIEYGKILFVSSGAVEEVLGENVDLKGKVDWIDENSLISFDDVHALIKERMADILAGRELPRGITGWYYQQFLKMQYALSCQDEYYMVWDGDTIPCRKIEMFQAESGKPYLDLKHEYHKEYFETMSVILPGFDKVIERSFISEHMLFKTEIMRNLICDIEKNDAIDGKKFWEKIINAIPADKIQNSAFSEFETYGTYVALKYSSVYKLREWHSFRQGGSFFDINTICDRDFEWLSKDFQAISFEKGHTVRSDNANLFDNPYYQEKLTPKQMLQAAQMEYKEGYKEVWADDNDVKNANVSSGAFRDVCKDYLTDRLKYLNEDIYKIYYEIGKEKKGVNDDQAYLCFENAEFLCPDPDMSLEISRERMRLLDSGKVCVKKTAFIILSYNNTYLMQQCIESIYTNCSPESFLLVIFDNGSTDGAAEWLTAWGEEHDEAIIILSEENMGFSVGCNEACKYVPEDYDVFFLNNDTRMTANSLFWLRMALYEAKDVGSVGAIQNYAINTMEENVNFSVIEQYMEHGARKNVPEDNPYEEQCRLCGFAMLIKREAFDKTIGFDERFNPGYLEDDDLSLQIRNVGYRLILVHNSFIYHAGSQSFRNRDDIKELFDAHREVIVEKWGFDSSVHALISENEIKFIYSLRDKGYDRTSFFKVLHIGCGCGAMLGHIHYLYPNAKLVGIEPDDNARKFAISCIEEYKSIEEMPYELEKFDEVANNIG